MWRQRILSHQWDFWLLDAFPHMNLHNRASDYFTNVNWICFPFNTMWLQSYNECICVHCFCGVVWFPLNVGFLIGQHDKSAGWLGLGFVPLVLEQHRVNLFPDIFMDDCEFISWKLKSDSTIILPTNIDWDQTYILYKIVSLHT